MFCGGVIFEKHCHHSQIKQDELLLGVNAFLIPTVHAKNEASGLVLTWAHNLFVMWALDFLTWIVLSSETQQNTLLLQIPPLSLLLLSLCSLLYVLSRIIHQPQFPILISYL